MSRGDEPRPPPREGPPPELLQRSPGGLTAGFVALPRGAAYLARRPRFWPLAALPLALNVVLFLGLFYLAFRFGLPWLIPQLMPDWPRAPLWIMKIVQFLIWFLAIALTCVLGGVSFVGVGMILAAPFNDMLSEWVEGDLMGQANQRPLTVANLMEDVGRTVGQAARKMLIVGAVFVVSLPLLLLPVIGAMLYTLLNSVVTIWFTALEYLDLPMSRAGWDLERRRAWAWERRSTAFGFGGAAYLTLLVPLVGFLVMPAAVAGGTILFLELDDPRSDERVLLTPGEGAGARGAESSGSGESEEPGASRSGGGTEGAASPGHQGGSASPGTSPGVPGEGSGRGDDGSPGSD